MDVVEGSLAHTVKAFLNPHLESSLIFVCRAVSRYHTVYTVYCQKFVNDSPSHSYVLFEHHVPNLVPFAVIITYSLLGKAFH